MARTLVLSTLLITPTRDADAVPFPPFQNAKLSHLETKKNETERDGSRSHLHVVNARVGRRASKSASSDDAAKEEGRELSRKLLVRVEQRPEEPSREETVVEALAGGEALCLLGELLCESECLAAAGSCPEEHLKDEDVAV